MKIIILISILVTFLVCSCEKEPKVTLDSRHMEIIYRDKSGNDLLNPSVQNHYSADNIHVFNIVNGIKKEVYYPLYDLPRNFEIYKIDTLNQYHLMVHFETDTTLLQLNESVTDTLISKWDNNRILKKFWYNGELKWDDIMLPQEITIIK